MSEHDKDLQMVLEIWHELSDEQKEKLVDEAIRLKYEPTLTGGPFDGFCPSSEAWNGQYLVSFGRGRVAVYVETDIGTGRFLFKGTKPTGEGVMPDCYPEAEGRQ